jgi:hypothetical protein
MVDCPLPMPLAAGVRAGPYEVDGQRFLLLVRSTAVVVPPAVVVLNWAEGLR